MIHELLKNCKICNQSFETNIGFCTHIKIKHDLSLFDYVLNYLDIPICQYCNKNKVEVFSRPLGAALRSNGRFWKLTCSNKECKSKFLTDAQINFWSTHQEAVEEARQRRVNYLKQKTGKTAWERRAAGEMSYLEQWFFDECIQKFDLFKKYDIVNEYCESPYFIDFAFMNIKVAVELDGKQHFIHGETRKGHDNKKDAYLDEKGWTVFRIGYSENTQKTINEFLKFISNIDVGLKKLENRVFKYKEVNKKAKRSWLEYLKEQKMKLLEMNKPLIELVKTSNIDFTKNGWISKVAILIDKPPQKIRRWMEKYMPDLLQKCKKRKSPSK